MPHNFQITETLTMPSAMTTISTTFVPAYSGLGLTGKAFGTLSILVICILAVVTVWIALKSKTSHKPKQAKTSHHGRSTLPPHERTAAAEGIRLYGYNVKYVTLYSAETSI